MNIKLLSYSEILDCFSLVDVGLAAGQHPARKLRPGSATMTDSCHKVIKVTAALAASLKLFPELNVTHYKKFTEAYGIPVLGEHMKIFFLVIIYHEQNQKIKIFLHFFMVVYIFLYILDRFGPSE